ncbi:response regulator [Crocosphaera sp. XPORK-15E]|uniref:response regulator n=1 Tax=Crocosphaera sp. XPORK-15E TaxID=3110247 RepID=UPI002B212F50|nr:response regulator [Crocosphaera sp. XPORK-15E]MEA5535873.1 response regulator [Crocosphaera sp. XPORK-15E]
MTLEIVKKIPLNQIEETPSFSPIKFLGRIAQAQASGCLILSYNSVTWRIYVQAGELIYANHSLDSFDRLERHLRRLSYQVSSLTAVVRNQARLNFDNEGQNLEDCPSEYQAINWLVTEKYLNTNQAASIVKALNIEIFDSFLLLKNGQYKFIKRTEIIPPFVKLNLKVFIAECKQRLRGWAALYPVITSPDQRPYFFSQNQGKQQISPEKIQKLSKFLRGFSFRQLAVLTNQDDLKVAQYLHQLILDKIVVLREPQAPFDKLPQLSETKFLLPNKSGETEKPSPVTEQITFNNLPSSSNSQKNNKLLCVDDSPTILREISRFLENQNLSIQAINDSQKALLEIIRFKPDIILLDVGMPGIDGYKLCQLIRNHPLFKNTPIVMVTGNRGLIDRAKARVAGASDYLTKPFSQADLLKMVFRYLT